ncbi:hypothetical protein L873DRAFT_1097964 [Choiromyces venosus 120613-1]|uniref:Uncharacterized protein n=1 Tax=Choiromyces venosus 120613-1 TaxID=1336337 RepID=A0A3N4JHC6_9PEZI|nr:hypothetical protein L873DRAFT_1097964 [Choiromyces venosus 120613-1]
MLSPMDGCSVGGRPTYRQHQATVESYSMLSRLIRRWRVISLRVFSFFPLNSIHSKAEAPPWGEIAGLSNSILLTILTSLAAFIARARKESAGAFKRQIVCGVS